jgi:hypothetical protein
MRAKDLRWLRMNVSPQHKADEIPVTEQQAEEYTPLLLAFGPADHHFEEEGTDDADAYVVGYN